MNFFQYFIVTFQVIIFYYLHSSGLWRHYSGWQRDGLIYADRKVWCSALDISTFEGDPTIIGRNVGQQAPNDAAKRPRKTETWTLPMRKPKDSSVLCLP